ncbi:hypothetical protein QAD02_018128 [Eretmocerus hayati]|uniref:Uncharacterized protein n=1 Tax=Eretmocerus hayati TaxID=131215 RepID=A0ACC2PH31_9HYME|nr:hypothetical protein QAD02_018128 [Eretmocerus hayati]
MSISEFSVILELVRDDLTPTSNRPGLSPELKSAAVLNTLRFGAKVSTQSSFFLIGLSTMQELMTKVPFIIYKRLPPIYFKMPQTEDEWIEIANKYYKLFEYPHCCGALDGKHFKIKRPPNSGSKYCDRKDFYSIVLIAMCDARRRFTYASVGNRGGHNDAGIFQHTTLAQALINGDIKLPAPRALPGFNTVFPYQIIADRETVAAVSLDVTLDVDAAGSTTGPVSVAAVSPVLRDTLDRRSGGGVGRDRGTGLKHYCSSLGKSPVICSGEDVQLQIFAGLRKENRFPKPREPTKPGNTWTSESYIGHPEIFSWYSVGMRDRRSGGGVGRDRGTGLKHYCSSLGNSPVICSGEDVQLQIFAGLRKENHFPKPREPTKPGNTWTSESYIGHPEIFSWYSTLPDITGLYRVIFGHYPDITGSHRAIFGHYPGFSRAPQSFSVFVRIKTAVVWKSPGMSGKARGSKSPDNVRISPGKAR